MIMPHDLKQRLPLCSQHSLLDNVYKHNYANLLLLHQHSYLASMFLHIETCDWPLLLRIDGFVLLLQSILQQHLADIGHANMG